jgi:hypothetical protein
MKSPYFIRLPLITTSVMAGILFPLASEACPFEPCPIHPESSIRQTAPWLSDLLAQAGQGSLEADIYSPTKNAEIDGEQVVIDLSARIARDALGEVQVHEHNAPHYKELGNSRAVLGKDSYIGEEPKDTYFSSILFSQGRHNEIYNPLSGMCLDINFNGYATIHDCYNQPGHFQSWEVTDDALNSAQLSVGGFIRNRRSAQCLTVGMRTTKNSEYYNAYMANCADPTWPNYPRQLWRIDNGFIYNPESNTCLDVLENESGGRVTAHPCYGQVNNFQVWEIY